jgi:predicted 3-demethylubiquinone-9 3-methyltransferase (glyoxalase superfamily)
MTESAIENFVVNKAKKRGFFVRKVKWLGIDGAPDRMFAHRDRGTVFIEFKDTDEIAKLYQTLEHAEMRAAGVEVHVCDNVQDALRILGIE